VYVVRLREDIDRDAVVGELASRGVPARPYFSPLHLQPLYRSQFGFQPGDFPVTERVAASTLALPYSSRLSEDDVDHVATSLAEAVRALDRRSR
jgi:perosamine synthetase